MNKDNSAILQEKGSLRVGFAYRFQFPNSKGWLYYVYYRSAREAGNEAIRLYGGYNVPTVEKIKVLIGKDMDGTFFIDCPEKYAQLPAGSKI